MYVLTAWLIYGIIGFWSSAGTIVSGNKHIEKFVLPSYHALIYFCACMWIGMSKRMPVMSSISLAIVVVTIVAGPFLFEQLKKEKNITAGSLFGNSFKLF